MDIPATCDIFQSGQYKLNRVLLSLLGQWPLQRDRNRRLVLFVLSFIGLTQFITEVRQAWKKVFALVTLRGDFDATIECTLSILINIICIVKLLNLISNIKKIKALFTHVQSDWESCPIRSEFEILHKFAEIGRNLTIGYTGCVYVFGILFSFLAIIPKIINSTAVSSYSTRPVGFPFHVEYYVDLEKYYYPALIHNYLASMIRLTITVAADSCMAILVQHCCGLFSIVRYRLEHVQSSIEQDKGLVSLRKDDKTYLNFVYSIRKHEVALKFAGCLETIYVKSLFIEIGLVIFIISLSALQANISSSSQLAIQHASYISLHLMHLFNICWLGQQIIDHSNRIHASTYRNEWYKSSYKSKKLLNMMMLRSISPCTLTAGKFIVLSIQTFSVVVRMSASYFTLLQSVK